MEPNPAQSRPASVDSVNLGSTYSGFYSSINNAGVIPQTHIPQTAQYANQYHSAHYNGTNYSSQQPQQMMHHSMHSQSSQAPTQQLSYPMPYNSNNPSMPTSNLANSSAAVPGGSAPLSYHYSISASAAAAAAFVNFQQQQQHNQTQQSQQNSRHFQPIDPQQQTSAQSGYAVPSVQWPLPVNNSPYPTSGAPIATVPPGMGFPTQQMQQAVNPNVPNNDYYTQYYSQYYREYYRRLLAYHQQQQQAQIRQKTPLKYGSRLVHARAAFSAFDNQLLVVQPNSRVGFYSLQDLFTEKCYPHLFLQTLLVHVNKGDEGTNFTGQTLLPINDSQVALDWIRVKLLNDSNMNYELKLILKVITMLYRQNGVVSGLDLSELLFELVSNTNTITEQGDNATEKMSQSGHSEAMSREQLLIHLRLMLMKGQRRVAITFAQNNGLFDHAIALAYLTSFQSGNGGQHPVDNGLMLSTIRKFINTTMTSSDPLYVFYSYLLQIVTNSINTNNGPDSVSGSSTTTKSDAKIDSLESFIILLANDIKFDKVEISNKSLRNLIDLMVALLKQDFDYILPDKLFHDRFDCLLVNECLEFARFNGKKQITKLTLRKLEFAFELFDYGFISHAANYLYKIREKLTESDIDLKQLHSGENYSSFKSQLANFLLPLSNMPNEEENSEENKQFVQNLWFYQMAKIFTRISPNSESFDSPLIKSEETDSGQGDEEDDEEEDNDEETEIERTEEIVEETDDETEELNTIDGKAEISENKTGKEMKKNTNSPQKKKNKSTSLDDQSNLSLSFSNNKIVNSTLLNNNNDSASNTPVLNRSNFNTSQNDVANNTEKELIFSPIEPETFSKVVESNEIATEAKQAPTDTESISSNNSFNNNGPDRFAPNARRPPSITANMGPRMLNTIDESKESSLERTEEKSLSSLSTFDYNQSFNMNPLASNLPQVSAPLPTVPSTLGQPPNESIDDTSATQINAPNTQQVPTFFSPIPVSNTDTSGTFDFVSTNGHVSSIPLYDPIAPDEIEAQSTNCSNEFQSFNGNNQFLQNYNDNSNKSQNDTRNSMSNTVNNSNTNNSQKVDSSNNSESSKNSPSKNSGLFNVLFGRLRQKNQAILPDDKDPSIVYDPVTKRWIDKTATDQGGNDGGLPPPPKMPINSFGSQSEPNSTLSSPQNSTTLPSLPTFGSLSMTSHQPPQQQPQTANSESLPATTTVTQIPPQAPTTGQSVVNGGVGTVPFSIPTPPPSSNSGSNMFRSGIRKNRYIDVFNAPPPK